MKEKKERRKILSVSKHPHRWVDGAVKSKIVNTPPLPIIKVKKESGMRKYYSSVKEMSEQLRKNAIEMSPTNLLTAKMALWGAVELVKDMIEERKQ